jgi:hypothetical protein
MVHGKSPDFVALSAGSCVTWHTTHSRASSVLQLQQVGSTHVLLRHPDPWPFPFKAPGDIPSGLWVGSGRQAGEGDTVRPGKASVAQGC